jgi:glycosyltransferase involved in cell wall biosynthesis
VDDSRLSCTIVIPVLNDAPALARCLRALEGQLLPPDEVVVVDNGSDDESASVAMQYGATVVHEAIPGIGAAAAHGYDIARSDLILRLDADSVPPKSWTSQVVRTFSAGDDLDAITGPGVFAAVPSLLRRPLTGWYWRIYFEALRPRIGGTPLFGSNMAMRRSAWRDVSRSVHRNDVMVHDDLDLSIHLLRTGHRLEMVPSLRVAVSARPLIHPFGMLRRARRAAHTLALHPGPSQSSSRSAARQVDTTS